MSVTELLQPRAPQASDIVWPSPTINSVNGALEAAGCLTERLSALFASNTDDMQMCLLEDEGLPERLRSRAYSIWMIYVLAGEKLGEIDNLIGAITEAKFREPVTSIGRHVDIRRRSEFIDRLGAFRAANAVPMPEHADDETFNSIADPVVAALGALIRTRAPDLRALHEKLTVIREEDAFNNHGYGAIDALFADIEYLARRYEIDAHSADQAEG